MKPRILIVTLPMIAIGIVPASAADLPVVVEPVDYVRICDAYGTGFYFIPGTDTCLSVSARIRADYNVFFDIDEDDFDVVDDKGFQDFQDGYRFRARGYIYMDSRTSTEFGLLRTYSEFQFTRDGNDEVDTSLEAALIEFGGLLFGRTDSLYEYRDMEFTPTQFFDAAFSDTNETNVIAYQFEFNETFSALIALEDETERRSGILDVFDPLVNGRTQFVTVSQYNGTRIPDVVGRIRAEGEWGSAQIMGATHYVEAITTGEGTTPRGNTLTFTETQEELGFAVGGGVTVNVPFGSGTQVGVASTFARGAQSYASTDVSSPFDIATDAIIDGDGDLELNDYWSISGGFGTDITPEVYVGFQVGFLYADIASADVDIDGDGFVDDDLDFTNLDLQGFIGWTPISGMLLGVGAEYRYVDTEDFGEASFLTTYLRAQRTF